MHTKSLKMSVTGNHIDISYIGKNPDDQVITFDIQFICNDQIHDRYKVTCHTGQYISDINEILTNIKLNVWYYCEFYYHKLNDNRMQYIQLKDDDRVSKIVDNNIKYNTLFVNPSIYGSHRSHVVNIKSARHKIHN